MVTAEIAVALPALLLVTALGVGAIGVTAAAARCADAARAAARALARGETESEAVRRATELAPAGADVRVVRRAEEVEVDVRATLSWFGGLLPEVSLHQRVTASVEDSTGAQP
jgi:hypothetical protein